jgi:plastocyanin
MYRIGEAACAAALLLGVGCLLVGQAPPAPMVDRVGFPSGYQSTFKKMLTFDRPDNRQIRVVWTNDIATGTPFWERYPYGSVLLFEAWNPTRDAAGALIYDENGRLIPDTLATVFVKRKGVGFGEAYGQNRNGEWEYVSYRPDGTVVTAPSASASCAICHLQAGPQNDWTFRRDRMWFGGSGAAPQATMSHYSFLPGDVTVKKGATVTWYNDDEVEHQINVPGTGKNSDTMSRGASWTAKFDTAGDYEVRCTIHPGMRAKLKVVE